MPGTVDDVKNSIKELEETFYMLTGQIYQYFTNVPASVPKTLPFSSPPLPSLPAPDHGLFLLLNSVSHACSSTQTAVLQLPPAHQFSSLSVSKIILFDKVGSH